MQRLKIDVKKIDKSLLFVGTKGTYMDITLMDNREGPDEYGNDGFIVQDVGKDKREAGIKGPIIGNWKYVGQTQPKPQQQRSMPPAPKPLPTDDDDTEEIPF